MRYNMDGKAKHCCEIAPHGSDTAFAAFAGGMVLDVWGGRHGGQC